MTTLREKIKHINSKTDVAIGMVLSGATLVMGIVTSLSTHRKNDLLYTAASIFTIGWSLLFVISYIVKLKRLKQKDKTTSIK